jgi:hypothetical protein
MPVVRGVRRPAMVIGQVRAFRGGGAEVLAYSPLLDHGQTGM